MRRFAAIQHPCVVLFAGVVGFITSGPLVIAQDRIDPAKVVGRDTCKKCHAAEQAAWEHSSHHLKAWNLLEHPKAKDFAKALGIADVKKAKLCTSCHGTPQEKDGQLQIGHGNSCESCHGGAGGKEGWLETHYDFGLGRSVVESTTIADLLQDREKESAEHRIAREAASRKAGMNRSADVLAIASNCLKCHIGQSEELMAAGHAVSKRFEFVAWAQGEVRHNFLMDPKSNAEAPSKWISQGNRTAAGRKRLMLVAGQLADLTLSLRARAKVTSTKRGTLGDEANDRILDLQEELEDLELPGLKPALNILVDIDKKSLRKITEEDESVYSNAADAFLKAAQAFLDQHRDGNKLPTEMKIPPRAKGEAFQE